MVYMLYNAFESGGEGMNEIKSPPVADYMKIRQYVVAMTERNCSPQAMIPSMNELARSFGVTRMTVHKALKDLIRDKYLIVRKGIGTFVNPAMVRKESGDGQALFFGIVVGNGKHCFYDAYYWKWISAFGQAVTDRAWSVKIVNVSSVAPKDIAKEIKDNFIDGVAWIDPYEKNSQDALKQLRADGFPSLALQAKIDGVDCLMTDWEGHAYEIAGSLLKEGRRNIVYADFRETQPGLLQLRGMKRAFADAGVKFNEGLVLRKPESIDEDLSRILELGIDVQAVYITGPNLQKALPALRKFGVDLKTRCRLVAEPFFLDKTPGYCGIERKYPFEEIANAAVDSLSSWRDEAPGRAECRLFKFAIAKHGGIK